MKKFYIVFSLLLIICFFSCTAKETFKKDKPINSVNINQTLKDEFRGIWVSTVYRMDYPSAYTKNEQILKNDIDAIIKNSVKYGFNAVIFQVRPAADAFYNSSIFPWSKYLTGTQGQAPANGFDPLEYIIEKCHQFNLELHAWINPYRITTVSSDKLVSGHIALSDPEYTVDYQDKLYFNPGVAAVRKIIIDGVKEIAENYDVDGIHFDDYFYPDKNFNDAAAFLKYNGGFLDVEDWRRNNNDLLIKDTFDAVKKINPKIKFGVSPPGIWANKSYNILGSETNGYQAYYDIFADSLKWVKNNWLDYIVPQIYWHIGNSPADYSVLLNWWADAVKNTNVKLYMGMACYKADDISYGLAWAGGDEIERQIILNRNKNEVSGMVFFRYLDVATKPVIQQQAENYFILENLTLPNEELDKKLSEEGNEKPLEEEKKSAEEVNEKFDKAQNEGELNKTKEIEKQKNNFKETETKNYSNLQKKHRNIIIFFIILSFLIFLFIFIKGYFLKRR